MKLFFKKSKKSSPGKMFHSPRLGSTTIKLGSVNLNPQNQRRVVNINLGIICATVTSVAAYKQIDINSPR